MPLNDPVQEEWFRRCQVQQTCMVVTITITDMFTDNAHWLWMRVSKLWPPDMKGPWSQICLFTNSEFLLSDSAGKILWKHHENPSSQTRLLCCWILWPGISLLSAGEFTGIRKVLGLGLGLPRCEMILCMLPCTFISNTYLYNLSCHHNLSPACDS